MHTTGDIFVTLPQLVSKRARENSQGTLARIPVGPTYLNGFKDVSYVQLHNAINVTTTLLLQTFGKSKTFETLAYIGPTDLRYFVVMTAGMKAGYKVRSRSSIPGAGLTSFDERSSCLLQGIAWQHTYRC